MKLKELIENNLVLSIMALAICAFLAGWGAYEAVIKAGNSEVISKNELKELRDAKDKLDKPSAAQLGKSATTNKLKVVFVDALQRRYFVKDNPLYQDGNAAFLVHRVASSDIGNVVNPASAIIDRIAPRDNPQLYKLSAEKIEKEEPDIVVIHRSAFCADNENNERECDGRLLRLLKEMTHRDTVYIVYSRKFTTNSAFAARLANEAGIQGRLYVYEFKDGYPFDDGLQVDHFFQTLLMLVRAQISQKV